MDMKNSEIKTQLENYRIHRKLNRDLLISLDRDQSSLKPFGFSGTFGKQFRHLLDIERCYVESLITGALTFYRSDIDHSLEIDKERLIHELDMKDKELEKICESFQAQEAKDKSIDCSRAAKYLGNNNILVSPAQILTWLAEHEIFHEGELALYVRNEKLKFPSSWMVWGSK
jgi:uncharacterized damage-inducible protein DinB